MVEDGPTDGNHPTGNHNKAMKSEFNIRNSSHCYVSGISDIDGVLWCTEDEIDHPSNFSTWETEGDASSFIEQFGLQDCEIIPANRELVFTAGDAVIVITDCDRIVTGTVVVGGDHGAMVDIHNSIRTEYCHDIYKVGDKVFCEHYPWLGFAEIVSIGEFNLEVRWPEFINTDHYSYESINKGGWSFWAA